MSFLVFESFDLPKNWKPLLDFIQKAEEYIGHTNSSITIRRKLDEIFDGRAGIIIEEQLLKALRKFLKKYQQEELIPLFKQLSAIAKESSQTKRQFGWPAKEWAHEVKEQTSETQYRFKIDVKAAAYMEVAKAEGDSDEFYSKLHFGGQLGGTGSGQLNLPQASFSASIQANTGLDVAYHYAHKDALTGITLIDNINLLTIPSDGKALIKSFAKQGVTGTTLKKVTLKRVNNFSGSAGIEAKFPTQYGQPGIRLSGEIAFGNNFECEIVPVKDKTVLRINCKTGSRSSKGFEVGVTYLVGLSTLMPEEAQKLLSFAKETHAIIVEIDEYAKKLPSNLNDAIISWLKPGDLISKKISEYFNVALDQIKHQFADDMTVLGGLARLVGIDSVTSITADKAITAISSHLTELLKKIIDDDADIFNVSDDKLKNIFKNTLDDKIIEILDMEVFKKISEELENRLKELSEKIDETGKDLIEKIDQQVTAGKADTTYKKLISFISSSRSLSKKILDGISKAQTDLISAELGYALSREGVESLEYSIEYDIEKNTANTAFRNTILRPSNFVKSLLGDNAQPQGVEVISASSLNQLTATKGPRWSVAFIGFPIGYSSKRLRDLDIEDTSDGIRIKTKQEVEKTQHFYNESRRVSFLSTTNVLQARENGISVDGEKDVGAAATLGISFEEVDGNTSKGEIKTLFKTYKKQGLIESDLIDRMLRDTQDMIDTAKKANKKAKFTTTIGLSVPPAELISVLKKFNTEQKNNKTDFSQKIIQTTARSLVENEKKKVALEMNKIAQNTRVKALGMSMMKNTSDQPYSDDELYDFLMALVEDHQVAEQERLGFDNKLESKLFGIRSKESMPKSVTELVEAAEAIRQVIAIVSDLYFSNNIPVPILGSVNYETQLEEFEAIISVNQKKINSIAGKFLRVGRSLPSTFDFLGGVVPIRTVTLYKALQDVIKDELGVMPPLLISLKVEGGTTKTYLAPRAS